MHTHVFRRFCLVVFTMNAVIFGIVILCVCVCMYVCHDDKRKIYRSIIIRTYQNTYIIISFLCNMNMKNLHSLYYVTDLNCVKIDICFDQNYIRLIFFLMSSHARKIKFCFFHLLFLMHHINKMGVFFGGDV